MKTIDSLKIIRRSGQEMPYQRDKIITAITKANNESTYAPDRLTEKQIEDIADNIETYLLGLSYSAPVEDIQDKVITEIMKAGAYKVAKDYTEYRYLHSINRTESTLDKNVLSIVEYKNENIKQENSNKNPQIASVQRDYVSGEVSKDISRRLLLPKDVVEAHDAGIIHFHDMDYFLEKIYNCCLVNLGDMLSYGTVISETGIDSPHSFSTACNIGTQAIAQIASSQYGGQTISLSHLAPFVDISRQKFRKQVAAEFEKTGIDVTEEKINEIAEIRVKEEINRGVQMIQYQVITLMTTNGQAPFVTVFMYLDEVEDGQTRKDLASIIEEMLNQRIKGVKNEKGVFVTPAFPKLIYVLDEDNIHEDSEYFYLTKLAAKCTAKRMVPDYISAKKMKEYKGYVYPCMGCVDGKSVIDYKINGIRYVESFERAWNRLSETYKVCIQDNGRDLYMDTPGVSIYDNKEKKYVNQYRMVRNLQSDWCKINFTGGRYIDVTNDHPFEVEKRGVVPASELNIGDVILRDVRTSDQQSVKKKAVCDSEYTSYVVDMVGITLSYLRDDISPIPHELFSATRGQKMSFLSGMIKANSFTGNMKSEFPTVNLVSTNEEFALQQMYYINDLGLNPDIYKSETDDGVKFIVKFNINSELASYIGIADDQINPVDDNIDEASAVTSIVLYNEDKYSYDVTTESEHFTVNGIYSHNCRSFLTPDRFSEEKGNISKAKNFEEGKPKYYGRFNQGVVTINLVDVACSSEGDFDKFWEILEDRLNLCHKALRCRHERLLGTPADIAPILFRYGAIARLEKGEKIDPLLYDGYSTISLGYAGLSEMCYYMIGKSHTSEEGEPFAKAVMQKLNDKCNEWKKAENIDYSVYGTPLESTTYKFAKCLKKRFGIIPGVTDKNYITNSYHCNVREKISAFDKLTFESKFQQLSPGGAISYVEVPDMTGNIDAVIAIMQHIYETIMYAEINSKSDYCMQCGYDGEIQIVEEKSGKLVWECPNCGNRDQDKMSVARRTCGYIGTQFWNQGRTQEIKDRVLHVDFHYNEDI